MYAVAVNAYDTPDAIAKIKNLASGWHLETIRSPLLIAIEHSLETQKL
jgi:hypothetical protein